MNRTSRITGPRTAWPMSPLDPRDHAWRSDLSDIALASQVAVPCYVEPLIREAARQTAVFSSDDVSAPAAS